MNGLFFSLFASPVLLMVLIMVNYGYEDWRAKRNNEANAASDNVVKSR